MNGKFNYSCVLQPMKGLETISHVQNVSEYDQEISLSHIAHQPKAPQSVFVINVGYQIALKF